MEFQYNDKRYMAIGQTLFELNFGRYPWKDDLMVQMEFLILKDFLIELQKSWEQVTKLMEKAQENMKRQFDKKRRNPQGLKVGDNV